MRIAIDMVFSVSDYQNAYSHFVLKVFNYLSNRHPEHEFIFLFDSPHEDFIDLSNCKTVRVGPSARHSFWGKLRLHVKIPQALSKYKADVFVCGGSCSLATGIPQCMLFPDLAFWNARWGFSKWHFASNKSHVSKYLSKAKTVVTGTEHYKQEIIHKYKQAKEKVHVVYRAANETFGPVSPDIRDAVKNNYAEGKEYFLFIGPLYLPENVVSLLKAFSIFKRRQRSNMKFLLLASSENQHDSLAQNLKTYKYRDDVAIVRNLSGEELVKILGSAYALVYPSSQRFDVPLLEAMKCQVPSITLQPSSDETAREAVLYADTGSIENVADKMMLIYKNENLRKELIEKGTMIAAQYSWDRTAEMLWRAILKAVD